MDLSQITLSNVVSNTKVFCVLAIIWFFMAFVSKKRRVVSTVIYSCIGCLMLLSGIVCLVAGFIYLPPREKWALVSPIVFVAIAVFVLAAGLVYKKEKEENAFHSFDMKEEEDREDKETDTDTGEESDPYFL